MNFSSLITTLFQFKEFHLLIPRVQFSNLSLKVAHLITLPSQMIPTPAGKLIKIFWINLRFEVLFSTATIATLPRAILSSLLVDKFSHLLPSLIPSKYKLYFFAIYWLERFYNNVNILNGVVVETLVVTNSSFSGVKSSNKVFVLTSIKDTVCICPVTAPVCYHIRFHLFQQFVCFLLSNLSYFIYRSEYYILWH